MISIAAAAAILMLQAFTPLTPGPVAKTEAQDTIQTVTASDGSKIVNRVSARVCATNLQAIMALIQQGKATDQIMGTAVVSVTCVLSPAAGQ